MDIRPYRTEDFDQVVTLWNEGDLLRPWNDPSADIALSRRSPQSELFVAADAGGALGAVVMAGSDGHRGWLYYLAVARSLRRGGLGRRMVRHAERWLRADGVAKVNLMIRAENEAVRAFYARVGYEAEPRVVMARRLGDDG